MRSGRDIERLKGTFRKFDRRALPITRGSNYLIRANTKKGGGGQCEKEKKRTRRNDAYQRSTARMRRGAAASLIGELVGAATSLNRRARRKSK